MADCLLPRPTFQKKLGAAGVLGYNPGQSNLSAEAAAQKTLKQRMQTKFFATRVAGYGYENVYVFITVASDARGEEFRLHPLFQSFLRRRLRTEVGLTGVIAEHARCAQFFLERGSREQAVSHLLQAEDYEGAAEIIG